MSVVKSSTTKNATETATDTPILTPEHAIGNTAKDLYHAEDEIARWAVAESELRSILHGVAGANLVRRHCIGLAVVQAYNVSRQLVRQEEHAHLLLHVQRMTQVRKFGRRRSKPADPQPQPHHSPRHKQFRPGALPVRPALERKHQWPEEAERGGDPSQIRRDAQVDSVLRRGSATPGGRRPHQGARFPLEMAEDFEYAAVAAGVRSLADDLSAVIEQKRARAEEQALEICYTAEELARDPEHGDLIPAVERMRQAYQHDYGRAIPPRKKRP
jgi:hypothetical protein